MVDAAPMAVVCLTYLFLTRNWIWVCLLSTLLTYVATFLALYCPESPRWHLVNGRTREAIIALNQIAEMNGAQERIPALAIFVEDPTNFAKGQNPQLEMEPILD